MDAIEYTIPVIEGRKLGHKGLNFDEPLMQERTREGRTGVDFDYTPNESNIKTGQKRREKIGLSSLSEPQVIRHFVRLSQQNFSIDTGFYPLGSCTMKHNGRINEKMARLPGIAQSHPMIPDYLAQGSLEVMYHLQKWLGELTALPAVSLNPSAGAHGELAGLMTIANALKHKNSDKNVVLVSDSAHGTNPATAVMCGFKVKAIPTTKEGIVDMDAFNAALDDNVAALMLTNPSTAGLFDPNVIKIADALHEKGAYFYCDGANFNAIVGKIRPGDFGVDVMHINLHKTFSTPHGGGGPGSGPIAATEELRPFLPKPFVIAEDDDGEYDASLIGQKTNKKFKLIEESETSIGRVRAFQGHMGMFVRALSYMLSHGADGMRKASEDAVLGANYIMASLKDYYHMPFDGPCMHECLLSDKYQREQAGVEAADIAKTLLEYGMHAMTVYFPLIVRGAMLIEPTESETKETLDNFIALMIKIAKDVKENNNINDLKQNPVSTPRRRVDEVLAAKNLILT